MLGKVKAMKQRCFGVGDILSGKVVVANNIGEIRKQFGWDKVPSFERQDIHDYEYLEDLNERRIRDAEVVAHVVSNAGKGNILEIGTSTGMMTVLMAKNAPESHVFTVNIPPEEIHAGKGGEHTTIALETAAIGQEHKKLGLKNITQIYANTATWEPDFGEIDVAFIDGCHDTKFVYNDTVKILKNTSSGSFVLWHDFNPSLRKLYPWIDHVCKGIERLYRFGYLRDRIILLKDSWVGLYQVP